MKLLLKAMTIVDPGSRNHNQKRDVLIEDGIIVKIAEHITGKFKTLEYPGACVSPGWFDMHVNYRDPGFEYMEDVNSGLDASAAGGFTGVAVFPGTFPPVDSKSGVEYLTGKATGHAVSLHPVGVLSKGLEGKVLSEMYDMHCSGAIAFSDDHHPIADAGLLKRALLYAHRFNGLVMNFPMEASLVEGAHVNESATTTRMGLKGIPEMAESVMVQRDLSILNYTGGRLHFNTISTKESVDLIRQAKQAGLAVSCDVAVHNLAHTDEAIKDFDTLYKVCPPLRSEKDRKALLKGVMDATIDVIVSDHRPWDVEHKLVEFEHADDGMASAQTAYSVLKTYLGGMDDATIIERMAIAPRRLLGIEIPKVEAGSRADLTVFDPKKKWTFETGNNRSKSANSPYIGTELRGKALAIVNNKQLVTL